MATKLEAAEERFKAARANGSTPAGVCSVNEQRVGAEQVFEGLTKREWFAGLAMQALIPMSVNQDVSDSEEDWTLPETANEAVRYADALLLELEKDR